jgi:Type I restriction enzyme R protein N terminus (HSDR_N)
MPIKIPKKVSDRLSKQVGIFQKILDDAKRRDVNESDTVIIVTDMLAEVFGWNKYTEITSEQAIRGTYCDLAVVVDGSIQYLIEVKAVGIALKDNHLRQAINYGANQGVPWVVLTNGITWEVYRIVFEQPISHELVFSFDFSTLSPRKNDDLELLYLLCRSGITKNAIKSYHERVQVVNRFVIAEIIQSDSVLKVLRREIKRLAPDTKATTDEIALLLPDVLKRDVMEGEYALRAKKQVSSVMRKVARSKKASPREQTVN